jgi:ATP-dependent 26S proteasome regulatory subunit
MQTSTEKALDMKPGARGRRGRKDNSGQETVFNPEALATRADDLVNLYKAQCTAADDFSEAVKAVAEKAGVNAASVRKFIVAKAGDDFEEAKAKVLQLALVFEEVEA